MKTTSHRARTLACALLATTALATPALAQSPAAPSPRYRNVDDNGVDLVSGRMTFDLVEGAIGQGEGAVSLARQWTGSGVFTDNWSGGLYQQTAAGITTWYVELGGITDTFAASGASFVSTKGNGATLVEVTGTADVNYRYTSADGTVIDFRSYSNLGYPLQGFSCPSSATGACSIPVSVTKPNGLKFALQWDIVQKCAYPNGSPQMPLCEGGVTTGYYRFRGVTSSAGYSFVVNYLTNTPGSFDAPVSDWYKKTGVTFFQFSQSMQQRMSLSDIHGFRRHPDRNRRAQPAMAL